MTDAKQAKRGRPSKPGKVAFNFRMSADLRERLAESAEKSGLSLTEEAERRLRRDFGWEATKQDIEEMKQRAATWEDAARIKALRLAGYQILREIEAKPQRLILDIETLLAEADGIARGSQSGFVDPKAPPTASARSQMTAEQERLMLAQMDELKRDLEAARERLAAQDAAAETRESGGRARRRKVL